MTETLEEMKTRLITKDMKMLTARILLAPDFEKEVDKLMPRQQAAEFWRAYGILNHIVNAAGYDRYLLWDIIIASISAGINLTLTYPDQVVSMTDDDIKKMVEDREKEQGDEIKKMAQKNRTDHNDISFN